MASFGPKLSQMMPNGPKLSKNVTNCHKWYEMFQIYPKMVQNGPKLSKMISIGFKSL